jgi:predicted ATPase/DNA-binding SARP family transcriptional activator
MLGPLTVQVGGQPAAFRTDAERALLAYLAAHQGIPQRRDTLAGLLSPDRTDQEALTYLRNRLTRLRSSLGDDRAKPPWLAVDRKEIALRAGHDIGIDLTEFAQRLAAVESHPHRQLAGCPTCLAHLQAAVNLVRGELLAGLNFPSELWESWLVAQREHVQQRALDAMTRLREARIALGEWPAVLEIAQAQLGLEPWLEAAHRARMQALVQLGDRNAALAQYEECVHLLWDELGVEPEDETTELFERIKAEDGLQPSTFHFPPSPFPDNLPLPSGRFFGREAEQNHLLQRLVDPAYRLITLVGTGGIGKTRLALEVGQQVKASYPDGVWFVGLDAVKGGAEQIKIAVGEAAGLGQAGLGQAGLGQAGKQLTGDQVLAILRDKRLLLILDNCEPVLDEIGFIAGWLRRVPGLVILATSREPLNLGAEAVVLLEGLPTGEKGFKLGEMAAAEALFAAQAEMALAGFVVSAENLPQVRQVCRLVDGLPLGIALAAAWVRRRSLAQIIDSIEQSLDFLSSRQRDADPRHRSMRAVFETSWQMLAAREQAVLAALAVFPATFTAEAAAAVSGGTLTDLDLLCEKSLLQQDVTQARYAMHSLLRQFAGEKLASRAGDVAQAFVDYFYQYARNHQHDYAQLQPEWANFSAAIGKAHGLAGWQTVLDFVRVLDEPWFRQIRFQEMRAGLVLAVDAARALGDQAALAGTLLRLGEIEVELNDYAVAEAHLADALQRFSRLEESLDIAQSKYLLGRIKQEQAQDDEALALFEESRQIFADEQEWLWVAKNLNLMAVHHIKKYEDFPTASTYLEQAAELQRQQPLTFRYIETLRYLARTEVRTAGFAAAEDHLVEAAAVSRQQNNLGEYAAVLYERVILCKRRGQFDQGLVFGYECLANFKQVGLLRWEALIKTQLGLLHQARQEYPQGVASIQEGLEIFCELEDLYEQAFSHFYLSQLYAQIGDTGQSLAAKEQAQRLSQVLNDPHLQARFG